MRGADRHKLHIVLKINHRISEGCENFHPLFSICRAHLKGTRVLENLHFKGVSCRGVVCKMIRTSLTFFDRPPPFWICD